MNGDRDSGWSYASLDSVLTGRQAEVVRMVTTGATARQIGRRLGISERTVEGHLVRARTRLGVHSTAELIRWAVESGLAALRELETRLPSDAICASAREKESVRPSPGEP